MPEPNFSGLMRAQVVKNNLPNGELGVYIPKLMFQENQKPNSDESKNAFKRKANSNIFTDDSPFKSSGGNTPSVNYHRALPAFLNDNGKGSAKPSGRRRIPKVGTWIFVFFEDEDVRKCFWLPYSPSVIGGDISLDTLPPELASSAGDPTKITMVDIIASYGDGTIIAYDENGESGSFVIRHASGHVFRIRSGGGVAGLELISAGGNSIKIDDTGNKISTMSQDITEFADVHGNKVTLSGEGIVFQDCKGNKLTMDGGGMTLQGNPNVTIL